MSGAYWLLLNGLDESQSSAGSNPPPWYLLEGAGASSISAQFGATAPAPSLAVAIVAIAAGNALNFDATAPVPVLDTVVAAEQPKFYDTFTGAAGDLLIHTPEIGPEWKDYPQGLHGVSGLLLSGSGTIYPYKGTLGGGGVLTGQIYEGLTRHHFRITRKDASPAFLPLFYFRALRIDPAASTYPYRQYALQIDLVLNGEITLLWYRAEVGNGAVGTWSLLPLLGSGESVDFDLTVEDIAGDPTFHLYRNGVEVGTPLVHTIAAEKILESAAGESGWLPGSDSSPTTGLHIDEFAVFAPTAIPSHVSFYQAVAPVPVLATEVNRTVPNFDVGFSADADAPVLNVQANAIPPGVSVEFLADAPDPSLDVVADVAPPIAVDFAATAPVPTFATAVAFVPAGMNLAFTAIAPVPVLAADVTHTPPIFTVTFSGDAPVPDLAAAVNHVPPSFAVTYSGTAPDPVLAVTAVRTVPNFDVSFGATAPVPTLSAAMVHVPPGMNIAFTAIAPVPALATVVAATPPTFAVGFAGTAPEPTLSVGLLAGRTVSFGATAPLPNLLVGIDFVVPPNFVAFSGAAPDPVLAALLANLPPQHQMSFAAAAPEPSFAALLGSDVGDMVVVHGIVYLDTDRAGLVTVGRLR